MPITSMHDKKISGQIQVMDGVTFYGVMLALIGMAGSEELDKLKVAFPLAVEDAITRYYSPMGVATLDEWLRENPDVDQELIGYINQGIEEAQEIAQRSVYETP